MAPGKHDGDHLKRCTSRRLARCVVFRSLALSSLFLLALPRWGKEEDPALLDSATSAKFAFAPAASPARFRIQLRTTGSVTEESWGKSASRQGHAVPSVRSTAGASRQNAVPRLSPRRSCASLLLIAETLSSVARSFSFQAHRSATEQPRRVKQKTANEITEISGRSHPPRR